MKRSDLRKFAKTKHKGLPKHVESRFGIQTQAKSLACQIVEDLLDSEDS